MTTAAVTLLPRLLLGLAPRREAIASLAVLLLAAGCGPSASTESDVASSDGALTETGSFDSAPDEQPQGADAGPDAAVESGADAIVGADAALEAGDAQSGDGAPDAGDAGVAEGGPAAVYFETQAECARWLVTPFDLSGTVLEANTALFARGVDGPVVRRVGAAWSPESPTLVQRGGTAGSEGVLYAELVNAGVASMYQFTATGWVDVHSPYTADGAGTNFLAQPDGTLWVYAVRAGATSVTVWRLRSGAWTSFAAPADIAGVWDTGSRVLLSTSTGLMVQQGASWTPLVSSGAFGPLVAATDGTYVMSYADSGFGRVTTVVRVTDTGVDTAGALTLPAGCTLSLAEGYGQAYALAECDAHVSAWRHQTSGWTALPSFDGTGLSMHHAASARTPALYTIVRNGDVRLLRLASTDTWDETLLSPDVARRWNATAMLGTDVVVAGNRGIERAQGTSLVTMDGTASWNVVALAASPDNSLYAAVALPMPSGTSPAVEEVRRYDGATWTTVASSTRGGTQFLAARSSTDVYWTTGDLSSASTQHGASTGAWTTLSLGACAGATSSYFSGTNLGFVGANGVGYLCPTDASDFYYATPDHSGPLALPGVDPSMPMDVGYVGAGDTRTMLVHYHPQGAKTAGTDAVLSYDGATVQSWPASTVFARVAGVFGPSTGDLRWVDDRGIYQQLAMGAPVTVLAHPFLRAADAPQGVAVPDASTVLSVARDHLSVVRCAASFH